MFLIPWLAFFTLWAVLFRYGWGLRLSFLAAQVINGVLIVFVTETLSVFQALTFWPLAAFWSLILLINVILLYRLRQRPWPDISVAPFSSFEIFLLSATGLIVIVTGLIAFIAPPNNFDSIIYHMSRVAHWAYNGTVANYPTSMLLQLVIQPYSEYAILQTFILSGTDYYANMVQWSSMVGSLMGVSLLAEMLGGSRRAQLLAVLFAATVPMGIMQASSTQNDYLATFWALCTAVFAVLLITTDQRRWALLFALAFGLATLTKGISVILSGPFVLWAIAGVRWKLRHKVILAAAVAGIVLIINLAFLCRLTQLSANPFKAMIMGGSAVVEKLDLRGMVSNATRGIATELALPVLEWDKFLMRCVDRAHRWVGVGVNDPVYTVDGCKFLLMYHGPSFEDYATSWIHSFRYALVGIYAIFVVIRKKSISDRMRPAFNGSGGKRNATLNDIDRVFAKFMICFILGLLLFFLFVKWQEYLPRFHLPFFIMFSAVVAVVLDSCCRRVWLLVSLGVVMFVLSLAPLLYNPQRSVFPYGAISRSDLARQFSNGGVIFDWLMDQQFFMERSGNSGYPAVLTAGKRVMLQKAFPAQHEQIWNVLTSQDSFSQGLLLAPREELVFGRFNKVTRDSLGYDVQVMRKQLERFPGCRDIGFVGGQIKYEYPFWMLLNTGGRQIRIEHILLTNESKSFPYPRGEPEPCLILKEEEDGAATLEYKGHTYFSCQTKPVQVYVLKPGDNDLRGTGSGGE